MRLWWVPLGMVVLTFIAPVATACSLAGEPEDPARFFIWDHDLQKIVADTTVVERKLGGTCELSTVYDIERGRLAWPDSRPGVEPAILLWDFLEREPVAPVSEAGIEHGWAVDLVGDHIVHHSRYLHDPNGDHTVENRYTEFRTIHMETGEERVLPLDDRDMTQIILQDGHIHWIERGTTGDTLSIYDAVSEAYHAEDVPLTRLGLPHDARLVAANADWLVFSHSEGIHDDRRYRAWAYDVGGHDHDTDLVPTDSRLQGLPDAESWRTTVALDGDLAFRYSDTPSGSVSLIEHDLRNNEMVDTYPIPDLPRVSTFRVSDGRTVYGAYASEGPPEAVETSGGGEETVSHGDPAGPDPDEYDKTRTLSAPGSLLLVLLVGIFLRRRR